MAKKPCTNRIGHRFGKLVVVKELPRVECADGKNKTRLRRRFQCQCDCGNIKVVMESSLLNHHTRSCGCLRWKHNHSGKNETPTYRTWSHMIHRCLSPSNDSYKDYGARGIKVCDRWQGERGFENFLLDMGPRPKGKTLDRYPDNTGNYEPGNCRWATPKEQTRNTRRNRWVEHGGVKQTIADWANDLGIDHGTLDYRLKNWPLNKAMRPGTVTNYRRLSESEVVTIKQLLERGHLGKDIAKAFNVHRTTVTKIKMRQGCYASLPPAALQREAANVG